MPNKSASTVLDHAEEKVKLKVEVEELKRDNSKSTTNLEKYKIIYNKKAESEFFVDNSALAGFTGERILYMAIRELIENSLDSCESFSILPSIKISLKIFDQSNDLWTLTCEDNGTGINSDKLPIAVCSFLTSAKYMEKQQRGLFGVGLKMVAAFSTKDTDFPIKVWNKSIDEQDEYYFELRTDIGTNKPIVLSKKLLLKQHYRIQYTSGFRIEVILRAKLVPVTKNKIYEYVSETSIVNPYSSITFETDDGVFQFNRRTSIMPNPAQEILPHPSDMDLKTLKKAISKFQTQKMSLPKILSSSFQKLSYEKAKDIVTNTGLSLKTPTGDFSEHDLIKIVNICKKTKFQNPNTDHLSPIGREVLTIGMMSEYTIVSNKGNDSTGVTATATAEEPILHDTNLNPPGTDDTVTASTFESTQNEKPTPTPFKNNLSKSNFSVKVLKPVLTTYTSRTCVINNRPTVVETGLAYGGDIPSFKLYRFANKIPLLYDEGSDVAREVISEVEINKMGITKKQAKEQFSVNKESKKDRVIEVLPLHIFFHICSTKIPYKTAGKESIASEGELKYYMKSCLSELYRKLSTQIRKELKLKEAENKIRLYKHYLPFIVDSINESLGSKNSKLNESFSRLIENHLSKKPQIDIDIGDASSADSTLPVQASHKMDLADIDMEPDIQDTKDTEDTKDTQQTQKAKETKVAAFSKPNLNKLERKKKDNKRVDLSLSGKLSKVDPTRNVTKNKKPKGTDKKLIIKEKGTTNKKNKNPPVKTSVNRTKINKSFNKSSNQSKTKEVQPTIDSYSKRVNKGKKK
ncbi:DNA topoisomerase VI subunit B [Candidatus Nitrosocosmicus arcticus]|uniref:Type 2 DNA topoisomerase 6 subunit B n=1 Tax=Candidatus Nitrosocosmicus arcticus TaxID=2035267 RepID=A0A557SV34_9ARCH|nr:DNA topoisomerase VI subunit B [Candidatus Nitrosocosmicus arcticus]TVP40467.1 Type 2 DNA topoisomerase VI subunit B [Candidatus Nitrosocosmicus arcticus]